MGVKLTPISQTSLLLSWDSAWAEEEWRYEVKCQQADASQTVWNFQLSSNSSGLPLTQLKPRHKYQCKVRMSTSDTGQPCPTVTAWTLSDRKDSFYVPRIIYVFIQGCKSVSFIFKSFLHPRPTSPPATLVTRQPWSPGCLLRVTPSPG